MAINQITIVFTPCSPAPSEGYRVFYREVGEVDFIEHPDAFTSSPIIFQVIGPTDQPYEGYIVADCGDDLFSEEVPFETVLCPPPEGCCDPVVIDAEAETIIPDGSGSGSVSGSEGSGFLRLVYNVDMSGESVNDWNVFFTTSIFDSVIYSAGGTVVDLYTTGTFTLTGSLFENNLTILRVLDFADCVVDIEGHCFAGCTNLIEVDCPACLTIANALFFNCELLTTVRLPLVTVIPSQGFAGTDVLNTLVLGDVTTIGIDSFFACGIFTLNFPNCTTVGLGGFRFMPNIGGISLPSCTTIGDFAFQNVDNLGLISLPVCTDLGDTFGDDGVFDGITGQTITFTLLTATAGDGDVSDLQANNSVTLILV